MQTPSASTGELLDTRAAAHYLSLSVRTLVHWRSEGRGPIWRRLDTRAIRYRRADLDQWVMQQETNAPAEVTA